MQTSKVWDKLKNKNVLVFPCGSEIGLEINNALRFTKDFTLFGASSVPDHGKFVYKNYIEGLPNVDEDNFIEALNKIVTQYNIDFIFPAHDSVVLKLAQNRDLINAEVITSDKITCEICRSKKKTYEYFKDESFTPRVFKNYKNVNQYPVFLKPDVGQGSKGVALVQNEEDLIFYINNNANLLILEYLPGEEYTIDCFTDKNQRLRFVGMRERRRIKSGISVNSITLKTNEEVKKIAEKINNKLNLRGAWFFQVKKDVNGKFKLLEVAPRIAGTMSLYRNKGVNFPLLSLYDRMGHDVDIIENDYSLEVDRALVNRFSLDYNYEKVYIDFDDTLTYKGQINPLVMMFLYQCLNNRKKIVLVTKHEFNIKETLEKLKIDKNIFDEIIHITKDDHKYKYFKNDVPAIFIDDSYSERRAIYEKFGFPVFDLDSLESLLEWKK
jgi:predicted ATP-grasp superfamily ATP-dependent carboligase